MAYYSAYLKHACLLTLRVLSRSGFGVQPGANAGCAGEALGDGLGAGELAAGAGGEAHAVGVTAEVAVGAFAVVGDRSGGVGSASSSGAGASGVVASNDGDNYGLGLASPDRGLERSWLGSDSWSLRS